MAKKSSNKMASRQGRLNKKKNKSKPNVFKGSSQVTTENNETEQNDVQAPKKTSFIEEQPLTPEANVRPQIIHKKERFSNSAMSVYSYVGKEVRRICIIGGVIFIVLFSLTFVLR